MSNEGALKKAKVKAIKKKEVIFFRVLCVAQNSAHNAARLLTTNV